MSGWRRRSRPPLPGLSEFRHRAIADGALTQGVARAAQGVAQANHEGLTGDDAGEVPCRVIGDHAHLHLLPVVSVSDRVSG